MMTFGFIQNFIKLHLNNTELALQPDLAHQKSVVFQA